MKVLVVLLGLLTAPFLSGVSAVTVRISAYNATEELDIRRDPFTLGTRVLLTCNVTGLPDGSEALSYRWYHNCTARPDRACEIRDGDPYYRVVKDTLLVDVTSFDQGGRYYCNGDSLPVREAAITRQVAVADKPAPFLFTPTSLLTEHFVLNDVQQATGRDRHKWITCRSGGEGTRPEIWMGSELVVNSSTANSATIGLSTQYTNGLYHCLSAQSQGKQYFSLFLRRSVTLPTPTVSARDTSMWTLTSPDGSHVERYIVEFECRVRNITFAEKYMSVSASGGTGRVVTSVSCFGGLGQLYRVKVWAVSGPNISPALVCMQDGQCREEVGIAPTTVASRATLTTAINTVTLTTPTAAVNIATPTGPHPSSTGEHPTTRTFIGAGIGAGIFLLLVLSFVVVVIVVVVVVNRKAACKQKRDVIVNDNPYYNNTVVVLQELEVVEQGVGADNNDAHSCQGVGNNQGEGEDLLNFDVDYNPYEVVDREVLGKNTMTPTPKVSSTAASATKVDAVHAVVDKNKKNGAKKETKVEPTVVNKEDLYAMPMAKAVKITDKGGEVVVSGGVEEVEHYEYNIWYS